MSDAKKNRRSPRLSTNRRRFIQTAGASAGLVVAPPFLRSARGDSNHIGDPLFALGVASGEPNARSVVLWTRLVDDPFNPGSLSRSRIRVRWDVATDYGMSHIVRSGVTFARAENGHAVRVVARGLPHDQWLYFRFHALGESSRVGRTRTFPSPFGFDVGHPYGEAARTESMRFAVVSCQNYEQGFYPAWGDIAEQDLDFVVHTGDYIYEDGNSSQPLLEARNHFGGELFTVDDYRTRYAQYRLDQNLQDAHARFPFLVTWDDHEVDNNYAGLVAEEGAPFVDAEFAARRRNAFQVYDESMPLRQFRRFGQGSRDPYRLFRRLRFGKLADIHMLDTRQFRTDQPGDDGFGTTDTSTDPAIQGLLNSVFDDELFNADEINDPGATMLGNTQELWLARNLARSRAKWNVLGQQVMFMPWNLRTTGLLNVQAGPDFPGRDQALAAIAQLENLISVDAWDGYAAARARLLSVLDYCRPNNPVILTGDIHSSWAANILKDFSDPANSDVLAAEFVCSSISSTFLAPDPRPTDFIVRAGIPENPHIRYFDARFRGYALCDVDEDRWVTQYRAVGAPADLLNPDPLALVPEEGDPVFTAAEASIESGFNAPGERKEVQVTDNLA